MVAAPLSDYALADAANLIVEARVLARSNGSATLRLSSVHKGRPRLTKNEWWNWCGPGRVIRVEYQSQPAKPRPGTWWNEDCFIPGRRVRAHLIRNEQSGFYRPVWWNGIEAIR